MASLGNVAATRQQGIELREATRADADRIAAITADAWRIAYADILPPRIIERATEEDELVSRWHAVLAGEATILVTTVDGAVRGYVGCGASRDTEEPAGTGEIYAIYVDPDRWRGGLGARLMRAALERLAAFGFTEAMLWTFTENAPARRFYGAMGFEHDGTVRRPPRSGGAEEVRYRRSLATSRATSSAGR
jgi:ribosomal protein S18 acetylase RimI-like enzyme